ncbi:MAG: Zn-dependent hydrolase YycJ/WalJ [Candidatus Ozemobacter sibiricus]|jgi:phosphoribosyl 1,2-cyclic phosphodiesterase|uniref:Zn-dependent hydrolase YycJ/WalJ n=1 Tax=Candidatus Ozemobacter sibiricus TaxID=2268124 RepID=A0A367ZPR6_9BACT|nr:MAG: Zn-dependent hydrolase YycJ/WalJ [Candidatus Ozemobacter sibiricus]
MPAPDIAVTYLGSGSEGNCALLEFGSVRFLLDAGLSARRIKTHLAERGLAPDDLAGIILTHDHHDHVRGLTTLLKKHAIPVLAPEQTRRALLHQGLEVPSHIPLAVGREHEREGVRLWPFRVSHDAVDPIGLRLTWLGRTVTIATDFGQVTPAMQEHLGGTDLLCLESNHDPHLLQTCGYPDWLKRRIRSPRGHFSNHGVLPLVQQLTRPLSHLVLIHLSQEANHPDLVRRLIEPALGRGVLRHCRLTIAAQDQPTPRLSLPLAAPPRRRAPRCRFIQYRFDFAADPAHEEGHPCGSRS